MPTNMGVDGGYESKWDYHDNHLTNLTDKNFLSAARCIVYARPSKIDSGGADSTFNKIGVIQSYNWSEQKQVEMIFELGSDIPYLIPGRTTGQVAISRILVSGTDLINVLYANERDTPDGEVKDNSSWLRSIRDITIPMDLLIAYYDQTGSAVYTRQFNVCWIQSRSESIAAGQVIVGENVNIIYQNVTEYSTTPDTGSNNVIGG